MFRILFLFTCFLLGAVFILKAGNPETYVLNIRKANGEIKLDGILDEADWKRAERAQKFYQTFPYDTSFSETLTEVMVTYDDQYLYIAAICWDTAPGNYTIQSLKRDFSYPRSDAFGVYIDPFSDQSNGFNFTVNPLGVQREGLIENGGSFGVTTAWDNRWFSEVTEFEDRWEVEMAIPFKTLRYKKGVDQWRINFSRNNLKQNENSSWVPVPRQFNIATLAFTGVLKWDVPLETTGTNISLIPYVAGGYFGNYEEKNEEWDGNIGGDAKIVVTPGLNLDLTVNPDFSQVEVDRQVTNLSRFELFFPERRNFFIENSDLFGQFGFRSIRPFFSRRIGLSGSGRVPIYGGARLSGKLDQNWRIGVMNMQTQSMEEEGLSSQNYTVAAVQRKIFARSNIAAIVVNRIGFKEGGFDNKDYNTVAGLDYNIFSADNKWRGKIFYHHSFDDESNKEKGAQAVWLMYQDKNWTAMYNHEWVQKNYNATVGFVPRTGYFRLEPMVLNRMYPKKGKVINNHGPEVYLSSYWETENWKLTDNLFRLNYQLSFQNRSNLSGGFEEVLTFLTFPFDPTGTGGEVLPDSVSYNYRRGTLNYTSDFRKKLNYGVNANFGSYFNGEKLSYGFEVNYRIQPWAILSLNFERNEIWLPEPYSTAHLMLIGPRFEFSFSKSVFFTTFLQYNTQVDNFNINARFQWRFKPMSDLYIVLTENYYPGTFSIKSRAIVFKLNYWFTL